MTPSKNITENKKLAAGIAAVLLLLILAGTLIFVAGRKLVVGFYGLDQVQEHAFRAELENCVNSKNKRIPIEFVSLNTSRPLKEQTRKVSVVITRMGKNADEAVDQVPSKKANKTFLGSDVLRGASYSAAGKAGTKFKKISQVPLLFDPMEMVIDTFGIERTRTQSLSSWNEIEDFVRRLRSTGHSPSPFTFAGADNDSYLSAVSVLLESFETADVYKEAVETIKKARRSEFKKLCDDLCTKKGAPLYETAHRLSSWEKSGLLSTEMHRVTKENLSEFLSNQGAGLSFIPLSQHRLISYPAVEHYTTLPLFTGQTSPYYPSARPLAKRACVVSTTCAIPLSASSQAKDVIRFLVSEKVQENVCRATGLSPFLASCKIPDVQSDDGRFWIAATSVPLTPIGEAAFSNEKTKNAFVQALKNCIDSL